jgi:hypothetical protein
VHIADFALERFFARWEFAVKHVLCASDAEPFTLPEVLALADDDSRSRWEHLSLGYTESLGLPALREEIARMYDGLGADDVLTFAGAEEGVFLTMHALLQAGDHAVVVWPAYQSLYEVARSIGATVTMVPLDRRDWSLDVDAIAASMRPNTKVVVITFPHSPTGAQISAEQLSRMVLETILGGAALQNCLHLRAARRHAVLRRGVSAARAQRAAPPGGGIALRARAQPRRDVEGVRARGRAHRLDRDARPGTARTHGGAQGLHHDLQQRTERSVVADGASRA